MSWPRVARVETLPATCISCRIFFGLIRSTSKPPSRSQFSEKLSSWLCTSAPHLLPQPHTINWVLACRLRPRLQRNWLLVFEANRFWQSSHFNGSPSGLWKEKKKNKKPSKPCSYCLDCSITCVCGLSSNRWDDFQLCAFETNSPSKCIIRQKPGMLAAPVSAVRLQCVRLRPLPPICFTLCPTSMCISCAASFRLISHSSQPGQGRWSFSRVWVCLRFLPMVGGAKSLFSLFYFTNRISESKQMILRVVADSCCQRHFHKTDILHPNSHFPTSCYV